MRNLKLSFATLLIVALVFSSCKKEEYQLERNSEPHQVMTKNGNAGNALPDTAVMHFGDENAGSPFPPEEVHDASYHASDKIVPRMVNIGTGGAVEFHIHPLHQVAIYDAGTNPEDIDLSDPDDLVIPGGPTIPDFLINDPNNRVALSPFTGPAETTWVTLEGTFDEPGKYLVICNILPHFVAADMYGYVNVH
jgi:plastocyanin